jgi:hypothetical protein
LSSRPKTSALPVEGSLRARWAISSSRKTLGTGTRRRDRLVFGSMLPPWGVPRLSDFDDSLRRLYGFPAKGAQLAGSQPRIEGGCPDGAIRIRQDFEQGGSGTRRHDLDLAPFGYRQFEIASRVDRHPFAGAGAVSALTLQCPTAGTIRSVKACR